MHDLESAQKVVARDCGKDSLGINGSKLSGRDERIMANAELNAQLSKPSSLHYRKMRGSFENELVHPLHEPRSLLVNGNLDPEGFVESLKKGRLPRRHGRSPRRVSELESRTLLAAQLAAQSA